MVVGAKKAIQHVPSKGKISIRRLQSFTVRKRQSVIRVVYGVLLAMFSIILAAIDPVDTVTNWYLDFDEGSFLFRMWENPTYELFSDVYIFNYTNTEEYLRGETSQLNLDEIGPFTFQEKRTNENMTIDKERGVITMNPKVVLKFLPEKSVAHYKDVPVVVPNIALIAISTLLADNMGYFANAGAYYSISALGSKLFLNMTAEELLWGYDDPLVSIASRLLPGWIDFGRIGVMDRFYAQRKEEVEVELRNISRKYSINTWNQSPGLPEQGFTDWNTSIPCNRLKGTFEGLMLPPRMEKVNIGVFRKQACRVYPFNFDAEYRGDYGFDVYRYKLEESAFNKTSPYACKCSYNCLPDGFIDISNCYYGFPIALSKPHFLDTDPAQRAYFNGFKPNPEKHKSSVVIEPVIGAPLALTMGIQVNIAVRTSAGNPITRPLKDKVLPILWLSLYCKEPPPEVLNLLRLRFVIAPPLVITLEVILFLIGMFFGVQGAYRFWRPKYKPVNTKKDKAKPKKIIERRKSSVILNLSDNIGYIDDQELAKEAVSLLAITEDEGHTPDLLLS
ncbi:scavenger receptor class B member 1-like [Melitaea cinxia]|uniref:scavenger receptor class B member 1-like n=1 Tax=Melitaea cinxia TaxID=113334 RepID=UPI001E270460|nr:scavenger receptor class B member 1-like [Melitaea cinxia]